MNIGFNLLLWTGEVQKAHLPLFAKLKQWGYHGVEIPLNPAYSLEWVREMKGVLDAEGLACTCSAFLPPESSAIDPNPKVRERSIGQIQQFIDMAAILGSEVVMGPLHSPHKQFPGRGALEEEKQWCAEVLRKAGEYAQSHGIRLSVEFLNRFECYFLTNSLDALDLVRRVDHPQVGMTYDTHHAHLEDGSIFETILAAKDAINHIHISESHRGTPGKGLVNWQETFRAIQEIGYDDWLVVEAFGRGNPDLVMGANIWRNCFDSEEQLCKDALEFVKLHQKFPS